MPSMRFKVTLVTDAGARVRLDVVCSGRPEAERVADAAYPLAQYMSVIRVKGAAC